MSRPALPSTEVCIEGIGPMYAALSVANVPVQVNARPRGGDFLYSEAEFRTMLEKAPSIRY